MAKRFIDTDIFKKQFVRSLKGPYKLLWIYITTDCNHAGIWECDFEVAALRIGEKITEAGAKKFFEGKIIEIDGGSKWFIPSFIEFQYGHLSDKNRAHLNVIALLNKYDLLNDDLTTKGAWKPLGSPLEGAKEMDMEKEKEKEVDKVKEKGGAGGKTLINPFSENFLPHWSLWKDFKKEQFKFQYRSVVSEQAALNELVNLSGGREPTAIAIINQSIAKTWRGLFELKTSTDGTQNHKSATRASKITGADLHEARAKFYSQGPYATVNS